jgi:hypothetical protein
MATSTVLMVSCGGSSNATESTVAPVEQDIADTSLVETSSTSSTSITIDLAALEVDQNACFNSLARVQSKSWEIQSAIDEFDVFGNPYVSVFSILQRDLANFASNASPRVSSEIRALSDLMGSLYQSVLYQDSYSYDFAIQTSASDSSRLLYACADVGATCPDGRDIRLSGYNCE